MTLLRALRTRRGMTMIELIIMVGIAAFLLSGLSRGLQMMVKRSVENRNYTVALNLARKHMAEMNNETTLPAVAAETAQTVDDAFPNFIPTREVVSLATSGSFNLRQITVRVRLNSVSGAVLVRLDTYRTDLLTFGDGAP